jgi:hypothetical protein
MPANLSCFVWFSWCCNVSCQLELIVHNKRWCALHHQRGCDAVLAGCVDRIFAWMTVVVDCSRQAHLGHPSAKSVHHSEVVKEKSPGNHASTGTTIYHLQLFLLRDPLSAVVTWRTKQSLGDQHCLPSYNKTHLSQQLKENRWVCLPDFLCMTPSGWPVGWPVGTSHGSNTTLGRI